MRSRKVGEEHRNDGPDGEDEQDMEEEGSVVEDMADKAVW
jgi:hypothetical protein